MANTTFSGPVRSENGFETISINATTGTVTTTATIGPAMSVTTLSATGNITADSNLALVAGGMAAFIATNTAVGMGMYVGSGAPTVAAAKGSIYLRKISHAVSECLSTTQHEYCANSSFENQDVPSLPETIKAVANASAIPASGPVTVADLAPTAIVLLCGSIM